MSEADENAQAPEDVRVSNRDRRPTVHKSARANMPVSQQRSASVDPQIRGAEDPSAGGGRGFTYEWERQDAIIRQEIATVAAGGLANYVHEQTVPTLTWTIDHNLGFIPSVILLDGTGRVMVAEYQHPSVNRTVIVHGKPTAGTAYLRI